MPVLQRLDAHDDRMTTCQTTLRLPSECERHRLTINSKRRPRCSVRPSVRTPYQGVKNIRYSPVLGVTLRKQSLFCC